MKKFILIVPITGFLVHVVDHMIGMVWTRFVVQGITFHRYWGFVDTIYLFDWFPTVFLYTLVGYLFAYFMKLRDANWIFALAVFILLLELFLVHHYFTDAADIVSKIWAGAGYVVPSLAAILGYLVYRWLIRHQTKSVRVD